MTITRERHLDLDALHQRLATVLPPGHWERVVDDIVAIDELKRQHNAVVMAHAYMSPDIYHGVADVVGDSLALAREALNVDADVIVLAGVHFMAETAKLLNPDKTVLLPDLASGCSLAESITADDIARIRQSHPGVPVVTYVNTSAAVKAASDICCTSGNAVKIVESLGVPKVAMVPDRYLAANTAAQTTVEIVTHAGACEVHEQYTADQVRSVRAAHAGVTVIAHPECPPEVIAEADFSGSTAQMQEFVATRRPPQVALITECSLSDNIAAQFPEVQLVRSCQLCPHMRRNTVGAIRAALERGQHEITVDPAIADAARASIDRMLAVQ